MTSPLWLPRGEKWENMLPPWEECENMCRRVNVIDKSTSYLSPRRLSPDLFPLNLLYDPLCCCWWHNNSFLVPFQWSCAKSKPLTEKNLTHPLAKTRRFQSASGTSTTPAQRKGCISSNSCMAFNSWILIPKIHTHTHLQELDHRCFGCVEVVVTCNWTSC